MGAAIGKLWVVIHTDFESFESSVAGAYTSEEEAKAFVDSCVATRWDGEMGGAMPDDRGEAREDFEAAMRERHTIVPMTLLLDQIPREEVAS